MIHFIHFLSTTPTDKLTSLMKGRLHSVFCLLWSSLSIGHRKLREKGRTHQSEPKQECRCPRWNEADTGQEPAATGRRKTHWSRASWEARRRRKSCGCNGVDFVSFKTYFYEEMSLAHIVYAVIHYVVSDIAGGKFESRLSWENEQLCGHSFLEPISCVSCLHLQNVILL